MWLVLILLTAFFVSLQDISGKMVIDRVDTRLLVWCWVFFTWPLMVVGLVINGIPPLDLVFWKALLASTITLTAGLIFYFKAFKYSDLSLAVPMLAFTPLFLLVTSPLMLRESPSFLGGVGIIFIVAGAYVLNLRESRKSLWEPFKCLFREKGVRYMLMVSLLFSISGNLDKIGVVHSSPFMWLFMLHLMLTITLGVVMVQGVKDIPQQIQGNWPFLVAVGVFNALALAFQMVAITMTVVPYLIAVKRTSIIMTSLFGFVFFKEKGLRERLAGIFLMIFGVFMISFFQ